MTEAEWLACDDLPRLIKCQRHQGKDRQLRLFACACARRAWDRLDGTAREAIELAERFADGAASGEELEVAYGTALEAWADAGHAWMAVVGTGLAVLNQSASRAALYVSDHAPEVNWRAGTVSRKKGKTAERQAQLALFRDVIGNPFCPPPFHPACRDATAASLALGAYEEPDRSSGILESARLAVLADALEEAGCANDALLSHLRSPGPHVRGCWALDLILGQS
jgi:hypothetical protein